MKEPHDLLGAQTDAGVRNTEDDPVAAVHELAFGFNPDLAVVCELRRVRDEVKQALPHFAQIGVHDADVRSADDLEFVAVPGDLHLNC